MEIPALSPSAPTPSSLPSLPEEQAQTAKACGELFATIIPIFLGTSLAYCLFQCCCCCRGRSAPERPTLPLPRKITHGTNETSTCSSYSKRSGAASPLKPPSVVFSASTASASFTAASVASSSRASPINYAREDLLFDIQTLIRNTINDLFQKRYSALLRVLDAEKQKKSSDPFLLAMYQLLRPIHEEPLPGTDEEQFQDVRRLLLDALANKPKESKIHPALQTLLLEICYRLTTGMGEEKVPHISLQVNHHLYSKPDSRDTFELLTLRLPSPFYKEKLDPIFGAFLERAQQKKKKILYISHHPNFPPLELFRKLAKQYEGTFYALRLPVLSPFKGEDSLPKIQSQLNRSGFERIDLKGLFREVQQRYGEDAAPMALQALFYHHLKELLAHRLGIGIVALPAEEWKFHEQFPLIERAVYKKKLPIMQREADTSMLTPSLELLQKTRAKKLPAWQSEGWSSTSP